MFHTVLLLPKYIGFILQMFLLRTESLKDSDTEYVLKNEGELPVDACKGWVDPCEYCDKRFGNWIPVDEDVYERIPEKPGFFMIALKNKNITEVVSILFDQANIQKIAHTTMDTIKDEISNKRSKVTKSALLVRWMVIKKLEDKDNSMLCAHWFNNGVLPKYLTSWPGMQLLENSEALDLSKRLQKYCHLKKNPVWRKSKPPPSKIIEEVKKCNLHSSCETCDSYFSPWKSIAGAKDSAPDDNGLVMFSVVYGKSREVIFISSDKKDVVVNIKDEIQSYESREKYILEEQKFRNKNAHLEVRWKTLKDIDSDNACSLYAHWLNMDKWPMLNININCMPGEHSLNKNRHFVLRNSDKRWLYEIAPLKLDKFNKSKSKRRILDQLQDEEYLES